MGQVRARRAGGGPRGARPLSIDPDTLARRLARRRAFLCLDYDGTLVPIVPRPDHAILDDSGRSVLRALARHVPIAVISGRARTALRDLVRVPSLYYVGNHGLEISGPRVRRDANVSGTWRRELNRVLDAIEAGAPPGALIERKGVTASIHVRLVAATDRARWLPELHRHLAVWPSRGRVVRGKAVIELRPPFAWDKGSAVRWLMSRPAARGRTPVYLGDDTTDEDAFRAVHGDGVGVLVGRPRRSAARFRLSGPAAVRQLLARWVALCEF